MEIKENNIIFLLGAGCSMEADIPISDEMVVRVEKLLQDNSQWKTYRELYYYLRSSIDYSAGIFGNFGNTFNIEKLLIVMGHIEQRDKNIIYPFIGSWNIRLPEVAGKNFEKITELKKLINKELYEWVTPKDLIKKADYYNGFKEFQNKVGKTIRVFSLNYDQCFEKVIGDDNVEQGFDPRTFEWQQTNFDVPKTILFKLYKLHGSINWFTDRHTGKLMQSNHPISTDPKLIFGIEAKLSSSDPFFYYTSEFRRWILDNDCKLIVTIGYSYADPYINTLIAQALINKSTRQVLNITYINGTDTEIANKIEKLKEDITQKELKLNEDYSKDAAKQFQIHNQKAKEFLTNEMTTDFLGQYLLDETDAPFKEN